MDSSYSYSLTDANIVCHYILPGEKDFGVRGTIYRNVNTLPEQYQIHANVVNQMFAEKEPRDVVFLQVTGPGKKFDAYNKEKHKIPITLKAYIELLNFFATEYERVKNRMDADIHAMALGKEWLSLKPSITFSGPANITFRKTLAKHTNYNLDIYIVRHHEIGKTSITLRYTAEEMGMVYLHPPAMIYLSQDREDIATLLLYKGEPMPKKSRQS
jgi:hypothetical protein